MRKCLRCGTEHVFIASSNRWRCPECEHKRKVDFRKRARTPTQSKSKPPSLFLEDTDCRLYHGNCLEALKLLPDASVHMCATSPPFWAQRDYGVEEQIGTEETPEEWAEALVEVFREVRRVLRDDGTIWIEVADTYSEGPPVYKQKDLVGAPWLMAFALRNDGWYLRNEIIWDKMNPTPESIKDRVTKAHSTIFMLSKKSSYFYDQDAIREPHKHDGRKVTTVKQGEGSIQHRNGERWPGEGANARSVWRIPTEGTPFRHFASWPQKLVAKMILAGSPEGGTVLDPFAGSGTTLLVARKLARRSIGIELNEEYIREIA